MLCNLQWRPRAWRPRWLRKRMRQQLSHQVRPILVGGSEEGTTASVVCVDVGELVLQELYETLLIVVVHCLQELVTKRTDGTYTTAYILTCRCHSQVPQAVLRFRIDEFRVCH